jgi:hypothetical protein
MRHRLYVVTAAIDDPFAVMGNIAALDWIRDRFIHTLDRSAAGEINALLEEVRVLVDGEVAGKLLDIFSGFESGT